MTTTGTSSDNSTTTTSAAAAASFAAWSSQAVAYHHMYPNSYSPNQAALFYSNDPSMNNSAMYGANYRNQEMEFLQPTAMYGRSSEEFLNGWNNAHHQNFKIFN